MATRKPKKIISKKIAKKVSIPEEKKTEVSKKSSSLFSVSFFQKLIIVILIGIALFLAVKKFGKYVIVATVNNKPIASWQLNQLMNERYGESTLEEMVNRQLLQQLAKREDISISKDDLNKEIENIRTQLGGDTTVTETQIKDSANIKLLITKLSEKKFDLSVTDDEVKQYYDENKDYFGSQKFDDVKENIKTTLGQLKLQEKFSQWFGEERNKANVLILK